jgi:hypothetical protein
LRAHLRPTAADVSGTHANLPIRGMQDFHSRKLGSVERWFVVMPIGSHTAAPDAWHGAPSRPRNQHSR